MQNKHIPVLLKEVTEEIAHLNSSQKKIVIDATVGLGGHSREFVKNNMFVLGIDTDSKTLEVARKTLSTACPTPNADSECFVLEHANFINIDKVSQKNGLNKVDAILFDLGVNTPQLVSKTRGFSFFTPDSALDMRLDDVNQSVTAADLLNGLREDQLFSLFSTVCDYRESKYLAKRIVMLRETKRFRKVSDLLELFGKKIKGKVHPATKAFMALRMAVNSELENIEIALSKAFSLLKKDGELLVISFHSGEDKLVKDFMKEITSEGRGKIIGDFILPKEDELRINPSARSAKLRIIRKLA